MIERHASISLKTAKIELMVDMQANNRTLRQRARQIVTQSTGGAPPRCCSRFVGGRWRGKDGYRHAARRRGRGRSALSHRDTTWLQRHSIQRHTASVYHECSAGNPLIGRYGWRGPSAGDRPILAVLRDAWRETLEDRLLLPSAATRRCTDRRSCIDRWIGATLHPSVSSRWA